MSPDRDIAASARNIATARMFSGVRDLWPEYSVVDDFVEGSNTALISHTPDKAPSGAAWEVAGGGLWNVIAADDNLINATQGGANECAIDCGFVNQDFSCVMNMPAGGIGVQLLRWTDSNNQVVVVMFNNTNVINIYFVNAGITNNGGGAGFVMNDGQDYLVRSVMSDDDICHVFVDGTERYSYGPGTPPPNSTKIGFESGTGGAALIYDTVRVSEAALV